MRAVVEGNAADLEGLAAVLPPEAVAGLNAATAAELDRRAPLLDARRAAGEVRRCHGDLHLANIVLLDGRPVLFDCLEFSEDLASIDVLYDLAFLVMDLLERGLREPAWRLLQAYNDRRTEDAGLALMPLFLSVRAAVRAKIAGFTATGPEARRSRSRARRARPTSTWRGRRWLRLRRSWSRSAAGRGRASRPSPPRSHPGSGRCPGR